MSDLPHINSTLKWSNQETLTRSMSDIVGEKITVIPFFFLCYSKEEWCNLHPMLDRNMVPKLVLSAEVHPKHYTLDNPKLQPKFPFSQTISGDLVLYVAKVLFRNTSATREMGIQFDGGISGHAISLLGRRGEDVYYLFDSSYNPDDRYRDCLDIITASLEREIPDPWTRNPRKVEVVSRQNVQEDTNLCYAWSLYLPYLFLQNYGNYIEHHLHQTIEGRTRSVLNLVYHFWTMVDTSKSERIDSNDPLNGLSLEI